MKKIDYMKSIVKTSKRTGKKNKEINENSEVKRNDYVQNIRENRRNYNQSDSDNAVNLFVDNINKGQEEKENENIFKEFRESRRKRSVSL